MTHSIYTGVTQSGKTTLARSVSREIAKAKNLVIVYDPLGTGTLGGDWGDGAIVHENLEDFLDHAYGSNTVNAHLFMDEAHHIFAHDDKTHMWLLTQGRHYGLTSHLITQRPKKIHPDARTNCGKCFCFRLAQDDLKSIGADYGFSDLHKETLDKGDFLILNSGDSQYSRSNIFQLLKE
jgi:Zonular occludens toxin (Zot)